MSPCHGEDRRFESDRARKATQGCMAAPRGCSPSERSEPGRPRKGTRISLKSTYSAQEI